MSTFPDRCRVCGKVLDAGRCPFCELVKHYEEKLQELERTQADTRVVAAKLYAALKDYYHECKCERPTIYEVNRDAYAALRAYERQP